MSEISEELIMEFKEAFTLFDEDGDGYIKTEELGTLMRAIGQNPTEDELDTTINELKISGTTDKIDFKKFLVLMATKFKTTNSEEELREAFRVFDRDGLGLISAWELRSILTEMGEKLTEEEVKQIIKEAHVDPSGFINYENFITTMSSV